MDNEGVIRGDNVKWFSLYIKLYYWKLRLLLQLSLMLCGCNWSVRTNFGHEFHMPEQEKMSISTCARKHVICELPLKE
jgi:hypothetical protein